MEKDKFPFVHLLKGHVEFCDHSMIKSRRHFLGSLASLATLPAVPQLVSANTANSEALIPAQGPSLKIPLGLRPDMTVGIVSPASGVPASEVNEFSALCSQWGIRVKHGELISRRTGYLSASDAERAKEFMDMVHDPKIGAIVCGRGGYGVMRILPMLDYRAIRDSGKLIMGFSDITALLIAVYQLSGLVTFHGPVASSSFDPFTTMAMEKVIRVKSSETAKPAATATNVTLLPTMHGAQTIVPGQAKGRLIGGNLAMIAGTLGTRYEIDTTDAILFLEEISEEPYRIDRMLTQLWLSGKLQASRGVAIGVFRDCESRGVGIPGPSQTLWQVLQDRLGSLGIPTVYGLPFGHVRSKLTLPVGVMAEFDATKATLTLLEPAVA